MPTCKKCGIQVERKGGTNPSICVSCILCPNHEKASVRDCMTTASTPWLTSSLKSTLSVIVLKFWYLTRLSLCKTHRLGSRWVQPQLALCHIWDDSDLYSFAFSPQNICSMGWVQAACTLISFFHLTYVFLFILILISWWVQVQLALCYISDDSNLCFSALYSQIFLQPPVSASSACTLSYFRWF